MADRSDSRESENNWVITEPELPAIEDLGFEASSKTELESELAQNDTEASSTERELFVDTPVPEEDKSEAPEAEGSPVPWETSSHLLPSSTTLLSSVPESGTPDEGDLPLSQETVLIHQEGPPEEEPNTSRGREADVEGLRRRKGRDDIEQVGPGFSQDQCQEAPGDAEDGLSWKRWLLAILAIVGFGVLATLGIILDSEDGTRDFLSTWPRSEEEGPSPAIEGKQGWLPPLDSLDQAKLPSSEASGDADSLAAMQHLLDQLAKENQDIRLMQAELQAQKEELEALLRRSEGEALEVNSQQQNLAAENLRLAEALQQERSALSAAQGELRLLQETMKGIEEAGSVKSQQHQEEEPGPQHRPVPAELQEKEIQRLRSVLGSLRHDLAKAVQKASPEKSLQTELRNMEEKLARELEASEGEDGATPPWKRISKPRRGQEKPWHRRPQREGRERHRHPQDGPSKAHAEHHFAKTDPPAAHERRIHPSKKHPTPRESKPAKGDNQRGNRKAKKPVEPSKLWEKLARHPYQAPQGCSGIAECAHREGLAPVQKTSFSELVKKYLAGLGWAKYSGELVAVLDSFFGHDGAFVHDRVSFVDFLDEVEDALEDLAEHLGISEDEVDNFEEVILKQLGRVPGYRLTWGDSTQPHIKGHLRRKSRENSSHTHG